MGDKSTARDTMKKAGVPTVPGSDGLLQVFYFYLGVQEFQILSRRSVLLPWHQFIEKNHCNRAQRKQ